MTNAYFSNSDFYKCYNSEINYDDIVEWLKEKASNEIRKKRFFKVLREDIDTFEKMDNCIVSKIIVSSDFFDFLNKIDASSPGVAIIKSFSQQKKPEKKIRGCIWDIFIEVDDEKAKDNVIFELGDKK